MKTLDDPGMFEQPWRHKMRPSDLGIFWLWGQRERMWIATKGLQIGHSLKKCRISPRDTRRMWKGIQSIRDYKAAPLLNNNDIVFLNNLNNILGGLRQPGSFQWRNLLSVWPHTAKSCWSSQDLESFFHPKSHIYLVLGNNKLFRTWSVRLLNYILLSYWTGWQFNWFLACSSLILGRNIFAVQQMLREPWGE